MNIQWYLIMIIIVNSYGIYSKLKEFLIFISNVGP